MIILYVIRVAVSVWKCVSNIGETKQKRRLLKVIIMILREIIIYYESYQENYGWSTQCRVFLSPHDWLDLDCSPRISRYSNDSDVNGLQMTWNWDRLKSDLVLEKWTPAIAKCVIGSCFSYFTHLNIRNVWN